MKRSYISTLTQSIAQQDVNAKIIAGIREEIAALKELSNFCKNYKPAKHKVGYPDEQRLNQPLTISKYIRFKECPLQTHPGKQHIGTVGDYKQYFTNRNTAALKLRLLNPQAGKKTTNTVALQLIDCLTGEVLARMVKKTFEMEICVEGPLQREILYQKQNGVAGVKTGNSTSTALIKHNLLPSEGTPAVPPSEKKTAPIHPPLKKKNAGTEQLPSFASLLSEDEIYEAQVPGGSGPLPSIKSLPFFPKKPVVSPGHGKCLCIH